MSELDAACKLAYQSLNVHAGEALEAYILMGPVYYRKLLCRVVNFVNVVNVHAGEALEAYI